MSFPFQMKKADPPSGMRNHCVVPWLLWRENSGVCQQGAPTSSDQPTCLLWAVLCRTSSESVWAQAIESTPQCFSSNHLHISICNHTGPAHRILALPHTLASAGCVQKPAGGSTQPGMANKLGTEGSLSLTATIHTYSLSWRFISVV